MQPAADTPPTALRDENPLPCDAIVEFDEPRHLYHAIDSDGCRVRMRTSVTKVIERWCAQFNAKDVIAKNLPKWRCEDAKGVYNTLLEMLVHVEGYCEEAACERIAKMWELRGERARDAGTAMHLDFESILNGAPPPQGETPEVRRFRRWLAQFCESHGLVPFRTELRVADVEAGVAGSIDFLLVDCRGPQFGAAIVDFKRVNGKKRKLGDERQFEPKNCKGPMACLPDTSTGHYTAQLNLYWAMVKKELSDPPPPCLGLYLAQFYEDDAVNCFAVPTDASLAERLLAEERRSQEAARQAAALEKRPDAPPPRQTASAGDNEA